MGQFERLKNTYRVKSEDENQYSTFEKLEKYNPEFINATEYAIGIRNELKSIKNYKTELLTVKEYSSKLSKSAEEKRNSIQVEIDAMRFANKK